MAGKLVFIHTVPSLIPLFNDLTKELFPAETEVMHIADEILLKVVLAQGGLSPFIYRRVAAHVVDAAEAGASVVQVTCSSVSPCVDAVRAMVDIPVFKIDEPMVRQAVTLGKRIGVLATAPTTLKPTTDLVRQVAAQAGLGVDVSSILCEGAYPALTAGDLGTHDRIILEFIRQWMGQVDVLLLAQASMGRVADQLPASEKLIPILASPRLAMLHAAEVYRMINSGIRSEV